MAISSVWRRLAAVALVGAVATTAGCAEGDASAGSSLGLDSAAIAVNAVADPGESGDGGVLTVAEYSEPGSLDPLDTVATGVSGGSALAALYDVLVRYNAESGEYEPWLARDLVASEDFSTWTLTLRPGVTFSDGTPLDAAAVVASVQRYLTGGSDAAVISGSLESVDVVDPATVQFRLTHPWATFPHMLAMGAGMIVAPAATAGDTFTPIGAGPFTFSEYRPGEKLRLTARDDYWGGAPHVDGLEFVWIGSGTAALESLDNGNVDMATVRNVEQVRDGLASGYEGYLEPVALGSTMWINHRDGRPGADVRVREAIALAVDPSAVADRAYDGDTELAGKSIFHPESPWYTGVEPIAADPDAARALLDQAAADGYDRRLTLLVGTDPVAQQQALALQAQLQNVGFRVELDADPSVTSRITKLYVKNAFDLAIGSSAVVASDPFHQLNDTVSSTAAYNLTGYASPEMDAALVALQEAPDDDAERAALADIERLWNRDVVSVNLSTAVNAEFWRDTVHGVVPASDFMMLFGDVWKN
ncbi:ABC transporter substrate-binding protein [Prescottella sp. R16]|uniref:ABC transporter substrate-binding protein n=2 Tax=Prescottella sp. R16 TaxID=3064529 RepID=UPI00272E1F14|nr:ABC transporter substrate-binding protein [Prescottella sp. R16]